MNRSVAIVMILGFMGCVDNTYTSKPVSLSQEIDNPGIIAICDPTDPDQDCSGDPGSGGSGGGSGSGTSFTQCGNAPCVKDGDCLFVGSCGTQAYCGVSIGSGLLRCFNP